MMKDVRRCGSCEECPVAAAGAGRCEMKTGLSMTKEGDLEKKENGE